MAGGFQSEFHTFTTTVCLRPVNILAFEIICLVRKIHIAISKFEAPKLVNCEIHVKSKNLPGEATEETIAASSFL